MKKTTRLGIRVSPEEKQWWQRAANEQGLSLSAWISKVLNNETAKTGVGLLKQRGGYNDHNDRKM